MSELISGRLARWVRERGASPLLTYYDLATGERTELSGVSVANWVAKTSNLLTEELGVGAGEAVELAVAERNPGHWVSLVWQLACWQVGATVTLGRRSAATVVVVGPAEAVEAAPGTAVLMCSLHPLGLPLATPPAVGVLDYAIEVRAQHDQYAALPQSGMAPAWHDPVRQLTQADLLSAAASDRRRLIRPGDPWPTSRDALIAPLLGRGSSVVVTGPAAPEQLTRIADQEHAELPAGGPPGVVTSAQADEETQPPGQMGRG
jgi:uncharacterized protein (TIGR03089 family)